jgi:hypothetical protein
MSISDNLKPEADVPIGCVGVKLEFTDEESSAIASSMDEYATLWASQHGGGGLLTTVKVKNGMMAKALVEYAEDLVAESEISDSTGDCARVLAKARQAQTKAYCLHNLPIYIFQLASMFGLAGDESTAKRFYSNFLRAQSEFVPDEIDNMFLSLAVSDMSQLIILAETLTR